MGEPLSQNIRLAGEAATMAFGASLVAAIPEDYRGWLILLQGELGAGKTTLARAMLEALGHAGTVPSPTYTLVEPYELPRGTVYHVDLYRIADSSELEFLGWADLREGLRLVEWPERVSNLVDEADLTVALSYDGAGRRATVFANSVRAKSVVAGLAGNVVTP